MTAAKTLYVDHSIVAKPQYWPILESFSRGSNYRLVLSLWNLAEMAAASDAKQMIERLEFLERLSPAWILETGALKSIEVVRYLWPRRFAAAAPDDNAIVQQLSQVLTRSGVKNVPIGESPLSWIGKFNREQFSRTKNRAPEALSQIQRYTPEYFQELRAWVFPKWVLRSVPLKDPSGKKLTEHERQELADYCTRNKTDFLAVCPLMAVEDSLLRLRTSNLRRNPKPSDGPDLMHSLAAMAYCDVFLLDDGWAEECVRKVKIELPNHKLAEVHNPLSLAQRASQTASVVAAP